jgi:hypothetical protein
MCTTSDVTLADLEFRVAMAGCVILIQDLPMDMNLTSLTEIFEQVFPFLDKIPPPFISRSPPFSFPIVGWCHSKFLPNFFQSYDKICID